MNKKFLSAILFGALMVTSTGTFVSCKDYDDDIEDLQAQINAQKSDLTSQLSTLQAALSTANTEIAAAKQAAADAAAKANAAAADAALAKEAAAQAKADAIAAAIEKVEELKVTVDQKVDQAAYTAKINELSTQIAAIDANFNTLGGTVNENTAAVEALKLQMAAVEAYKAEIEKKANAADVAEKLAQINQTITNIQNAMTGIATTTALEEIDRKVAAITTQVAKIQADLVTLQGKKLRSLVFVPYLYVDGIETTEYAFALSNAKEGIPAANMTGHTEENNIPISYQVNDKEVVSYKDVATEWYFEPTYTVEYHLNPSTAEVTKEQLSFSSRDVESISSRAANGNESKANPQVKGASIADGILTVNYIANGKELAKLNGTAGTAAIMALNANIKDGEKDTTITSDYAQLYPSKIVPKIISYSKKEIGNTNNACGTQTKYNHIYLTAKEAIENAADLKVEYNGSLELKDYLNIHYNQSNKSLSLNDTKSAGDHKVWEYGEEAAYNLEYRYSLVSFTIGDWSDSEAQLTKVEKYGNVNATTGHFEPRYVDANGNSIASNGTSGVSAIGKKPVVRVEVIDKTSGKVILAGFVKIQIVRTIAPVESSTLNLGKQAYACGWISNYATWAQYSNILLETASVTSKAEFEQLYVLDATFQSSPNGGSTNAWWATVYVKQGNEYVAIKNLAAYNRDNSYFGYVEAYGNTQGVANDRIQWNTEQVNRDRIYALNNHTATSYICYEPRPTVGEGAYPKIYVPVTLTVVKPEATYGKKIAEYWYENNETQRLNVLYPKDGANTQDYTVDLNNAFVGNTVNFTITNNADKLFDNTWASTDYIQYEYIFTDKNEAAGRTYTVDGVTYSLKVSPDKKSLYAVNVATTAQYLIATLSGTANDQNIRYAGEFAPAANDVAKKLLNAWAHNDATSYYANVGILAKNDCGIELGTWDFNARFLRPVNVTGVNGKEFTDAEDNGSVINIIDLLSFTDWRDRPFTGSYGWYYAFYNVKGLRVDIDNITTTMNGGTLGTTKLKGVTTKCVFTQEGNQTFSFAAYNAASQAVNCLAAVKTAFGAIKYVNNGNNVQDFQVRIPVIVSYEWGDVESYVDCHVHNTINN